MRMKSRQPCVPIVMMVMSALAVTASTTIRTTTWPTTETLGQSLNGKMFTLSRNGGQISFFPPYYSPTTPNPWGTRRYFTTTKPTTWTPTTPWTPTTTTTTPWTPTTTRTPAPAPRGVSVCLRYLADDLSFTLSPSSSPLQLRAGNVGSYSLNFRGYESMYFRPDLRFWSNIGPNIWTRVCLTVDSINNVVQMFSGPNISIRMRLNYPYIWSGEPVIAFSGFDGQLTDVQIWDYPLRYKEVFNYMTSGVYAPYRGSALSWSDISYSPRGQSLLEDTYEWQARQPIGSSRVRKGRRPKGGKKTWALQPLVYMEGQREWL